MRFFFGLIFALLLSLFLFGCGDDEGGGAECQECGRLKQQIQQLTGERDALNTKVQEFKKENAALTQQVATLTRERDEAQADAKARCMALNIIGWSALGIGVVLIVGFFWLLAGGRKHTPISTQDDLHCPRCGWEHAPGETVCKNCKTHF